MWSHCMFCTRNLGRNEALETFPVGRRLVFDPEKGRLWVVCKRCGGWNLPALEERWETVEACERRFRQTRKRLSTGELGLARLSEGLELVRVGRPLRPEFAAWRYGDQIAKRRRRTLLGGTGLIGTAGAVAYGAMGFGIGTVLLPGAYMFWAQNRVAVRLRTEEGRVLEVRGSQLEHAFLTRSDPSAAASPSWGISVAGRGGRESLVGEAAALATARLLRQINRGGASAKTIDRAIGLVDRHGGADGFLEALVERHGVRPGAAEFEPVSLADVLRSGRGLLSGKTVKGSVAGLRAPKRLAFEMALHEEQERLALHGELWLLERAWQDAESIAGIADDLV